MTPDLTDLRLFVTVVASGSLGRAAVELNMTQPTLSRRIKELERQAGEALFERHSRGMTLSAAGKALLPHARQIMFDVEQATEALDTLRGLSSGTARVGAVAAVVQSVLPAAVGRLLDQSPGLRVEILESPEDRLINALLDREIDLMIAGEIRPHGDIVKIDELHFDDDYCVFCAAGHPLAAGGEVGLRDVLAQQWVMPGGGAAPRTRFEDFVLAAGEPLPRIAVETSSLGAMVALVAETRLLGWLPRPLLRVREATGAIRLLPVPALSISRRFFLYRHQAGLLPRAAQRMRECLPLRS